jgi:carbonic anhydrase
MGCCHRGRGYFAYAGSLTTPPCSETVSWMLLTNPIEVSETDVAAFARLYPMNARPAQKPNRRFVLRSG